MVALSTVMAAGNSAGTMVTTGISPASGPPQDAAPFGDLLADAVSQVTQLQDHARMAVEGLMSGSGVDVHEAMIDEQKAEMAFEMALSLRNKAVEVYQQVMGMQF